MGGMKLETVHYADMAELDRGLTRCGRRILAVASTADEGAVTCAACRNRLSAEARARGWRPGQAQEAERDGVAAAVELLEGPVHLRAADAGFLGTLCGAEGAGGGGGRVTGDYGEATCGACRALERKAALADLRRARRRSDGELRAALRDRASSSAMDAAARVAAALGDERRAWLRLSVLGSSGVG